MTTPRTLSLIIFISILLSGSWAAAQSKVLVLLTEETAEESETEPKMAFWWSSASTPEWTETDRALFDAKAGLFITPSGLERLSRIYRRPGLTDANAAALAELFDADVALVGTIRRARLDVSPLGESAFRVSVAARLVEPTASGVAVKETYALERLATGERGAALTTATSEVSTALSNLVSGTLRRRVGPVGVAATEQLIAFRGIEQIAQFRAIEQAMVERPDVDSVRVNWLAEGIVAVEINPGAEDSRESVLRVAQGLQNRTGDPFAIVAADRQIDGAVALDVKSAPAP